MREDGVMSGFTGIGRIVALAVVAAVLFPAAAVAQEGPSTIEPTLAECEAFVQENGVPAERPVGQNRGYSGYDICLNMAYDGDLPGYFAANDINADGALQSGEQRAYLDSVIGPVSDPDQSPLTLGKCEALVVRYGIPAERPFVDWGNRGYGEVDVCQALAYDGNLAGSFAVWDANGDGRLDRTETGAAVAGLGQPPGVASTVQPSEETPDTSLETGAQVEAASGDAPATVEGEAGAQGGESTAPGEGTAAAGAQYGDEDASNEATGAVIGEAEATIPAYEEETTATASGEGAGTEAVEEPEPSSGGQPRGVVASVGEFVSNVLPSTGGVALAGLFGGAVLVGGGFLAFRFLR